MAVLLKRVSAALLLAATGGCATLTESNRQTVTLQTIQDNREIAGAGCILANQAGRWFVTSPGRVTIAKSAGALSVDCKMEDISAGQDTVASTPNTSVWGNLVISAGLGYYVDKHTGAGFDYPPTLTVIMQKLPLVPVPAGTSGTVLY